MKKRWLAMLVVGCMLIGSMGMTAMADEETGGENGNAAGSENGVSAEQENSVPAVTDDNGLDANGSGTIINGENNEHIFTVENGVLKKYEGPGGDVTIPDGVTSIYGEAHKSSGGMWSEITTTRVFGSDVRKSLTSVQIPEGVTEIGHFAFQGCKNLTSVTLPESLTSIGAAAFRECEQLTGVTIPDSVTSIEDMAFGDCKALTSIVIPDGVPRIGYAAFLGAGIKSIIIPKNVTSIVGGAFQECENLETVTIKGDIAVVDNGISYPFARSGVTTVVIEDGVTTIPDNIFYGCENLKNVTVPVSVTSIKYNAFIDCHSLTDIQYSGTTAQWKKITIDEYAIEDGVTIHCTDGDIQISWSDPETPQPEESESATEESKPAPEESKPAPEEPKKNSGSSSSHSSGSSNQNNKTAPAPSAPKTEQEVVKETIENLPQGGQAVLETGSVIGSGELRKIMEKGGSMVVFSPQVSWHFDALTNGDMDFNPGIEVGADIPDLMQKLNGQSAASANATVLRFAHNGVLPGAAYVGIAVSYAPGTRLYFYYYNRSTGLFEFQQNVTVENGGYVVVNLTHCSDYVLTTEPLFGNTANAPVPAAGTGNGANGAAQGNLDSTPHTGI